MSEGTETATDLHIVEIVAFWLFAQESEVNLNILEGNLVERRCMEAVQQAWRGSNIEVRVQYRDAARAMVVGLRSAGADISPRTKSDHKALLASIEDLILQPAKHAYSLTQEVGPPHPSKE